MKLLQTVKPLVKPLFQHADAAWKRRNAFYIRCRRRHAIRKNTILYEAFYGRGLLDSPYALFLALTQNPAYKHYRHIWVLDDLQNHKDLIRRYAHLSNVSFVQFQSRKYIQCLATCEYLVNNVSFYSFFSKREGQIYVNTWHGIPLKCLGYDVVGGRTASTNVAKNFLQTDYLISANPFLSDIYKKSYMLDGIYSGEIIEEGYPRLDLLVDTPRDTLLTELTRQGVSVDPSKKIILYAPTWKGNSYAAPDVDLTPYIQFKEFLESHIDTEQYQILIKVHQVIYEKIRDQIDSFRYMIPATMDANRVLSVTDILISDYSSIFYDFLATGRPVLFYIPDLQAYTDQRGLYTTVDELPGPYTESLEQLSDWICRIDAVFAQNRERYDAIQKWCCDYAVGHISETIVSHIWGQVKSLRTAPVNTQKKRIVFWLDEIRVNGILHALLNLLGEIDYDTFDVTVISSPPKKSEAIALVNQMDPHVRFLLRESTFNVTLADEYRLLFFHKSGVKNRFYQHWMPSKIYREETARIVGSTVFDYSLDYCGMSFVYALLALHVPASYHGVWMHSDMTAERDTRMPWLSKMFTIYSSFDRLISCSRDVMAVNRQNLADYATPEQFTYCKNAVGYRKVLDGLQYHAEIEWTGQRYCLSHELSSEVQSVKMIPLLLPDASNLEPIRFLMIGRLSPEKNYESMIRAFARMVSVYPQIMLYIVGDGPLFSALNALIKQLGMTGRIHLVGLLDNPGILMPYCHCFVLSSFHEGQPVVLHEARTAGLPIIMSRFSSYAGAVIENGQYLTDPDEDSLAEGIRAFMEGRVPQTYSYDPVKNNREAYQEFLSALQN